jgi:hypothetical protein
MRAVNRRRVEKLFLVVSATVIGGCATVSRTANSPEAATYPLLVSNRSDFEVVVYAVQSNDGRGYRLGNARSFGKTVMNVPRAMLIGTSSLVLRLHAIGTSDNMNWTSQETSVDGDVVAELDINADANGNLMHSALYTVAGTLGRAPRRGH